MRESWSSWYHLINHAQIQSFFSPFVQMIGMSDLHLVSKVRRRSPCLVPRALASRRIPYPRLQSIASRSVPFINFVSKVPSCVSSSCGKRNVLHSRLSSLVCQLVQQMDAQNHDEQADGHDDQQGEAEPTQHHGACADAALDAAVAEVLCDLCCGYGGGVLP